MDRLDPHARQVVAGETPASPPRPLPLLCAITNPPPPHLPVPQMGTLVTTGPLKSQLGGWVPCATLAALSAKKFLIK